MCTCIYILSMAHRLSMVAHTHKGYAYTPLDNREDNNSILTGMVSFMLVTLWITTLPVMG